jgi:hypothetical protein
LTGWMHLLTIRTPTNVGQIWGWSKGVAPWLRNDAESDR